MGDTLNPNYLQEIHGYMNKAMPSADHIQNLVKKLDAEAFVERERASKELCKIGSLAEDQLIKALSSDSPEVSIRATQILKKVEAVLLDLSFSAN